MTNDDGRENAGDLDGLIWVYGVGEDGVQAFTDFGIAAAECTAPHEGGLAFRSSYLRPSLSDATFISENKTWKLLWKDSSSMYLKPFCSVLSS